MIRSGENQIDGVTVRVVRKRIRRINIRIAADGTVCLSVPKWWATLAEGEAFLRAKWRWVLKTRQEVLARPRVGDSPVAGAELDGLKVLLAELNGLWTARLGEANVTWKTRRMKTLWGSCNFRRRHVTYNTELARVSRELVEYVVVHELTHLQAHDHGPRFYALMDARLPGWRDMRRRLNRRECPSSDVLSVRPDPPQPFGGFRVNFGKIGLKETNGMEFCWHEDGPLFL